jgi:hypothetical protein
MASLLRALLAETISNAGIPISDINFINWYNEAVTKLALLYNTAKSRDTQTITCNDENTEYDITPGCVGIIRCLDSAEDNYIYYAVRENTKILFATKGTFTLHLYKMPTKITGMTDTSTIPKVYNDAIMNYVVSVALKKHSADKQIRSDAAEAYSLFTISADSANNAIRKSDNRYKQVATRRFR